MAGQSQSRVVVSDGDTERFRSVILGARMAPGLDEGSGPVAFLAVHADHLRELDRWTPPHNTWVEVAGLEDERLIEALRRAADHDLFCLITTATATEIHVAGRIAEAVSVARGADAVAREDLELALHEAVSNGLVHGNLGVSSMKGLSIDDLDKYSQGIAAKLADPDLATRRLEIAARYEPGHVTIDVIDEGAGYEAPSDPGCGASGRGLDLIASIAESCVVLDGGRRISMRFAL